MASNIQARWLTGKVIERVVLNPFDDGRGGTAHNPRIHFTDGTWIGFVTEETEVGEYGTCICYSGKRSNKGKIIKLSA